MPLVLGREHMKTKDWQAPGDFQGFWLKDSIRLVTAEPKQLEWNRGQSSTRGWNAPVATKPARAAQRALAGSWHSPEPAPSSRDNEPTVNCPET